MKLTRFRGTGVTEHANHLLTRPAYIRTDRADIVFDLPSGLIEDGEAPLAAAQRELLEETGYRSDRWTPLGSFVVNSNYGAGRVHAFLAVDVERVSEPNSGDLEAVGRSFAQDLGERYTMRRVGRRVRRSFVELDEASVSRAASASLERAAWASVPSRMAQPSATRASRSVSCWRSDALSGLRSVSACAARLDATLRCVSSPRRVRWI